MEKVRLWDSQKGISVEAYTDGYAYGKQGEAYLLSVIGAESAAKALTSGLVTGKEIEIISPRSESRSRSGGITYLYAAGSFKYRILSAKLACGYLHQIALADAFFNPQSGERFLFLGSRTDVAKAVYQEIQRSFPIPLVPEWTEWLYKRMRKKRFVKALRGTARVIKLNATEQDLDEIISEGVREGKLRF